MRALPCLIMLTLACSEPAPSPAPAAEPALAAAPTPEPEPEPEPEPTAAPEPAPEPEPPPDPYACPPEDTWPDGMACVRGGTFTIGTTDGEPDDGPPGEVTLSTFFYDVHEVTNEAYQACVAAGACPPNHRYRLFRQPRQPVVAVSWYGARDYCAWVEKRLPTDAEFERAAAGPEQTTFPWGDDADDPCVHAVVKTRDGEGCGTEITAEVGSRPAGHFGIHDLAGNVHEWVADHWSQCLRGCNRECGDACFGEDPRGPCEGAEDCPGHPLRSVRGGSWYWSIEHARAAARRGAPPANEGGHRFGFRCARDLAPES